MADLFVREHEAVANRREQLTQNVERVLQTAKEQHVRHRQLLAVLSPKAALRRGYAIVRDARGRVLRSGKATQVGAIVEVQLADASLHVAVQEIR